MPSSYHAGLQFPRFYPILDIDILQTRGLDLVDTAATLFDAGARILQLRHKRDYTRTIFEAARTIARLAREAHARLIVNDRADIALLLDAGVHVGQEDLQPSDVRHVVGPGRIVGFSTHNEQQMRAALAEPVDYVAFGPLFPTASKENPDPCVGLEQLRAIRALVDRPLIAIGGITRGRADEVLEAGANSLAVIGDLYPNEPGLSALRRRASEWIQLTDS
jgi:thiamine-phosphate pyrophosphorylase